MATKTYNQIRATMVVCLKDAEDMFLEDENAVTEDIRSTAISMAIEMSRSGAEPSARMRFLTKFYELEETLGYGEVTDILARHNSLDAAEIVSTKQMASIIRAMLNKIEQWKEEAANSPNANDGDEA